MITNRILISEKAGKLSACQVASAALILGVSALVLIEGSVVLLGLTGLTLTILLIAVAYQFPAAMVSIWLLTTQFANEVGLSTLSVGGGIDAKASDPLLLAIAGALITRALVDPTRISKVMAVNLWPWAMFFTWMLFEVGLSLIRYGIVPVLGEFRSYSQQILIVPYVAVFADSRVSVRRINLALLISGIAILLTGFVKGGLLYNFRFAAYEKWLGAHSALAVLFVAISVFYLGKTRVLVSGNALVLVTSIAALLMLAVTGHRSVWLAASVAVFFMTLRGHFSWRTVVSAFLIAVTGLILINILIRGVDLASFTRERMTAFTSYQDDNTANWRMTGWMNAISQVRDHVWIGGGLGKYFEIQHDKGAIVTVSLHNQYVQLVYQTGLISLGLFLLLVGHAIRTFWKTVKCTGEPELSAILSTSFVCILAACSYYIAYGFDYFTWVFVGLGYAAASLVKTDGLVLTGTSVQPRSWSR